MCLYIKYMWVYAGKFVLWVTIMQVCVCVWGCVSTVGQHVSCAMRLSVKTEGREGKKGRCGVPLRIKFTACSSVYIYRAHWCCLFHQRKHSKRKMDTHAHLKCYSISYKCKKYWTVYDLDGVKRFLTLHLKRRMLNVWLTVRFKFYTLLCRRKSKWHWWKC